MDMLNTITVLNKLSRLKGASSLGQKALSAGFKEAAPRPTGLRGALPHRVLVVLCWHPWGGRAGGPRGGSREAPGEHHHGPGAAALEGFHARTLAAHHRHHRAAPPVPRKGTGPLQHGVGLGHLGPPQVRLGASEVKGFCMAAPGAHGHRKGGGRADRGVHGAELVQHLLGLCISVLRTSWAITAQEK